MHRSLHRLLLVLPDKPRFSMQTTGKHEIRRYRWPCDCSAKGSDESALEVLLCETHLPFIVPPFTRATE
jgi:hypothetical protein